jgi:hypothetical protein
MNNFSKKNEKEKIIDLKSCKFSWVYNLTFVIILINYELYKSGKLDVLLILLLISQIFVYIMSKQFYLKVANNHSK